MINWDELPAEAMWVAWDEDGACHWYTHKPLISCGDWKCHSYDIVVRRGRIHLDRPKGSWMHSLVKRPVAVKADTFVLEKLELLFTWAISTAPAGTDRAALIKGLIEIVEKKND